MTRLAITLAIAALALAACGKRGDLETPEPVWQKKPVPATEQASPPPAATTTTPPAK